MSLRPGTLKVAGGLGALLVCGGAGVTVAADQHPAGAPLNPPVTTASAPVAASPTPGLVIPPTPVCPGGAGLSADQRLQATALRSRAAKACRGGGGDASGAGSADQTITPSVSDTGPAASPLTFSYVS